MDKKHDPTDKYEKNMENRVNSGYAKEEKEVDKNSTQIVTKKVKLI